MSNIIYTLMWDGGVYLFYEIKNLIAQEGVDIIRDLKINVQPADRLARVKCTAILPSCEEKLDFSLAYFDPQFKLPSCTFAFHGTENIRGIYFSVSIVYQLLTKNWSLNGTIAGKPFQKTMTTPLEAISFIKILLGIEDVLEKK